MNLIYLSQYFPKSYRSFDNVNVKLDLFNYVTK